MSIFSDLQAAFSAPAFRQQAEADIGNECLALLKEGFADNNAFIRETCAQLAEAFRDKARGELEAADMEVMLIGLQEQLNIEITNAQIALRTRLQNIIERLLDLSLSVLLKAL